LDNIFLNIKLQCDGKSLDIGKDTDYRLIDIEGIDHSDYELNISNNTQADGGFVTNKRVQTRPISMNVAYVGSEKEAERKRLISFFNPKKSGVIIANFNGVERAIEYEIESFKSKLTNIYEDLIFTVDFICPNPFWKDLIDSGEEIISWTGGISFPFSFNAMFATKGEPSKKVINYGDVEAPVEITFKGPAINPKIVNNVTGEFVRVKKQLSSDDTLVINTEVGNKKVEIIKLDGSRQNAFNYIDLNSTFLQLKVGDNLFEYSTEGLEPSSVSIRYKNRYLGV
jgi:phage-related protein